MRNRVVIGLVGGGILLVALALSALLSGWTPAQASGNDSLGPQPTGFEKYCLLYERTLASNLKVSVQQLEAANASALKTTIQQARKDGSITQAQETNQLNRANQLSKNPCAALAHAAAAHHHMGKLPSGARQAVVNATAAALMLPPATLESRLSSGQTVAQIATAQQVPLATVNTAYLDAVQSQLKMAVAKGTITQAQSDTAYSAIQGAVAKGEYPLLRPYK